MGMGMGHTLSGWTVLVQLLSMLVSSSFGASASKRRYSAYNYDLTFPQFCPDGRLLQVEYAMTAACSKSTPIACVGLSIPTSAGGEHQAQTEDESLLIMATISSTLPQKKDDGLGCVPGENADRGWSQDSSSGGRSQNRIIEVPVSSFYICDPTGPHRATTSILVGLSGLLPDAASLLEVTLRQLEKEQRMFGWHRLGSNLCQGQLQTREICPRLGISISDKCQTHAFGGGLRPVGASILLASVDGGMGGFGNYGALMTMCETFPNGDCIVSKKYVRCPQIMITGGSSRSRARLTALLRPRMMSLSTQRDKLHSTFVREAVELIVLSLFEQQNAELLDNRKVEVVLQSSVHGTVRIPDDTVSKIVADMREKSSGS